MRTLRRMVAHVGLLMAALAAALVATAQPAGAAGTPPIIRFFGAWAENRPGFFSTPHLFLAAFVDDPDGRVPLTIQSVVATDPSGRTFNLPYNYPNLDFRGEYFLDAGTVIPTGIYTLAVTDTQGNTATATRTLISASAVPPPPNFPFPEQILTTTTPTFLFSPIVGVGSFDIRIHNLDIFGQVFGDELYRSQLLSPGLSADHFAMPSGVLRPGRRYLLRVLVYDSSNGLAGASARGALLVPFSVAGPNVSLSLNQSAFSTGQTLHLTVAFRNDGAPLNAKVTLTAGLPGAPPVELSDFPVVIPSTPPDVSTVVPDLLVYTFTGAEPPGNYVLGLRVKEQGVPGTVALSTVAFSFTP